MSEWTLDPERQIRNKTCPECGTDYTTVNGFVHKHGAARAAYFAACHKHHAAQEVWIDAILGTWGQDRPDDHVTFGCRVGRVEGQAEPAATLVAAASVLPSHSLFGRKLSREEALQHPWLREYWQIVDFLLLNDPTIRTHLYGN